MTRNDAPASPPICESLSFRQGLRAFLDGGATNADMGDDEQWLERRSRSICVVRSGL